MLFLEMEEAPVRCQENVARQVAQTSEANAVVPGLLQHQKALAQGQLQTPHRRDREEELTVCFRLLPLVASHLLFVTSVDIRIPNE